MFHFIFLNKLNKYGLLIKGNFINNCSAVVLGYKLNFGESIALKEKLTIEIANGLSPKKFCKMKNLHGKNIIKKARRFKPKTIRFFFIC